MAATVSSKAEVAAALFHGFSERTRLSILLSLLEGEKRVVDLVDELGGSQSNISGHLACLKDCGLVTDRPQGGRPSTRSPPARSSACSGPLRSSSPSTATR